MTLAQLKRLKTAKPGFVEEQGHHKSTVRSMLPNMRGYNFLKLLRMTSQHSNYVYSLSKGVLNISMHKNARPFHAAKSQKVEELD